MLANVQRSKLTAILIYMLKRLYGGFKTFSFFFSTAIDVRAELRL